MKPENIAKVTEAIQSAILDEIGPEGTPEFKASETNYWKVVSIIRDSAVAAIDSSFVLAGDPAGGILQRGKP